MRVCKKLHCEVCGNQVDASAELIKERDALRAALMYGLSVMMPEIHSQKYCWPGEVDNFEDMAREALQTPPTPAKETLNPPESE